MYLACERSDQYRATKKLKHAGNNTSRITGTKKCGCPFDMRAHRFTTHDKWTLTVVCGLHNHPPAEHLEGHSYARRLSKDEKILLMDMSKSMVRPKEILVTLKQRDALNVSTLKTIYNVRHRNRVVQRAGRSQMQHLLGELTKYNYIERHRYQLPLLEIVGVTSTEMTFSVAFTYLQYERVDNYAWVLATLRDVMDGFVVPTVIVTDRELALMNAILKIFPSARHLLCRWHIMYSSSEIQYDERLKSLLKEFSSYPDAVKYVMDTWAESAHAKLKRQLGSCQVSFQASFEKIHSLLELQHTDIKDSFEKSLSVVQHQFKPSQFRELRGNVSISALKYLLVESKRANSIGINVEACGCGKEKVNPKGKAYITRTVKPGAYVDALPAGLKPYIKFVKDVATDGNCGFRAIAASIGHTENDWAQVRRDLLGELHTHKEEYITLYGSYERFEELTSILSYFEDSPGYSIG
ncbi:uncharacterized protein LOC114305895 [Camellia sinensis]|uniref:uncharacterized protein LOC114305895 n=1 Tax=Camellia sinensis TaxID=4442 RepID=UPI001036AA63|nr:uncharacterized protein LOC114305895 [Camellia sinensis]